MKKILIGFIIVGMLGLSACGSKYDEDFKSGMEKFENGEKMSEDEYDAVNDFLEWEQDQNNDQEKTFDAWGN